MTAPRSSLPRVGAALLATEPVEQATRAPGVRILFTRDDAEKARLIETWQPAPGSAGAAPPPRELLAALGGLPGQENGHRSIAPLSLLVLRPHELQRVPGAGIDGLIARLGAVGRTEQCATRAIRALRAAASAALDDDGGPMARLTARLRAIDDRLRSARAAEQVERGRIEALLAAAAVAPACERERDQLLAERGRWEALVRVWPDWQRLQLATQEAQELAAFDALPSDLPARAAAAAARCAAAESALRAVRRHLGELQKAVESMPAMGEGTLAPVAADAERLTMELPMYRSRLLELAATRARLVDLERTLAKASARRSGEEATRLAQQLTPRTRAALQDWQERIRRIRADHAVAEGALGAARERLRDLSAQVREGLVRDWSEGGAEADVCWRALWQLRTHLEEIWEVQSRAESSARTLREREEQVRSLARETSWAPSAALQRSAGAVVMGTAVASLWSALLQRPLYAAALAGVMVVFAVARVILHYRARWVRAGAEHRAEQCERLRLEIARLRRACDADWARAARLTDAIQAAAAQVGLPDPVTPELVEAREQQLAADTRARGADSPLTQQLLDLLDTQEVEPGCAAALASATAERQRLDGEWAMWLADTGLPPEIDIERAEDWVAEIDRVAAARAARDATGEHLRVLEPIIAAWETGARQLLERTGSPVAAAICGSALAARLSALAARVRDEEANRQRREELEAERRDAEQQHAAAASELEAARAARQALLDATNAADDDTLRAKVAGVRRWQAARVECERLQAEIDGVLNDLPDATADARDELTSGAVDRWVTARQDCDAQLEAVRQRLEAALAHARAAEQQLETASTAGQIADLQFEREQVLGELAAVARGWKLRMLAAALLERSLHEFGSHETPALLRHASEVLAMLTHGRFTAIVQSERSAGFTLVDAAAQRVAVDAQLGAAPLAHLYLSLVLGRAAHLTSRGAAMAAVLDDPLAALPPDDARVAARELSRVGRAHRLLYVASESSRAEVLSSMPGDVVVLDRLLTAT